MPPHVPAKPTPQNKDQPIHIHLHRAKRKAFKFNMPPLTRRPTCFKCPEKPIRQGPTSNHKINETNSQQSKLSTPGSCRVGFAGHLKHEPHRMPPPNPPRKTKIHSTPSIYAAHKERHSSSICRLQPTNRNVSSARRKLYGKVPPQTVAQMSQAAATNSLNPDFFKCTNNSEIAAGVTPEIREACPKVSGRC